MKANYIKSYTVGLLVALFVVQTLPCAQAQYLDNQGTEFIMGFLPNYEGAGARQLHITADNPTTVTVEYPLGTVLGNYAATPGAITIVPLPNGVSQSWMPNAVQLNTVRASAAQEFVCYMININNYTSDAALALPVDTMNTEYLIADYNPAYRGANFCVVAAYDNTTVTITPTRNLVGHAAGVPFTITLNRGQGYFAESSTSSPPGNTGTIVTSDRPVGVSNGDNCTQVPTGFYACDHIFEVAQPTQTWGTEVAVANLPNRTYTMYRIMASADNTMVTEDGVVIGIINRGQFIERIVGGSHIYAGDQPIFVWQLMTGQDYPGGNGIGDPAMANMIPMAQYLQTYTFATVGGGQFAQHWVTVIAETADATTGNVLLDGVAIPAGSFTPIAGSAWSTAILRINEGTHTTTSRGRHGITVEGYNSYDSYLYPGGARFQFINPVGDQNPPICASQPTSDTCWSGSGTDNRPSEDANSNGILDPGEDLNGNGLIDKDTGIFLVQLTPGSVNLALSVSPFIPGDPTVSYTVCVIDPGIDASGGVAITDGAGNTCSAPFAYTAAPTCEPPTSSWIASTKVSNISRFYREVFAQSTCFDKASLNIYIGDTLTPGFQAGPYKDGNVLRIAKGAAALAKPGSFGTAGNITVKGQATVWAVDPDGRVGAPVTITTY